MRQRPRPITSWPPLIADAVKPIYAWLYVRAATLHDFRGERDLDLFALAFRNEASIREYFAGQQWNIDDAEFTYLKRSADVNPGRFPEPLGADYPAKGEEFLLARSHTEEAAGRKDAALECMEVLLRLAPASLAGHDRLACLHYRRGDMDRAAALLAGWRRLNPADPWPVIRQAIIEQQRGNALARAEAIDGALGLTQGKRRAAVAFLGAGWRSSGSANRDREERRRPPPGAGARGEAVAGLPEL